MAHWLVKEEPDHYAFADLVRDGRTAWSGVRNPQARLHLRAMRPGDEVLYYHTGRERAAVGLARVISPPRPDPDEPGGWIVDLAPVRALSRSLALAELRPDPALAAFQLVRIPRLSVVAVTDAEWAVVLAYERRAAPAAPPPTAPRGGARRRRADRPARGSARRRTR